MEPNRIYTEEYRMPHVGDVFQQIRKDGRVNTQLVIGVDDGLIFLGDGMAHLWTELLNPREWTLLKGGY